MWKYILNKQIIVKAAHRERETQKIQDQPKHYVFEENQDEPFSYTSLILQRSDSRWVKRWWSGSCFYNQSAKFQDFPSWKLCCPISGCVMDSHRYSLVLFTCVPKGAMLSSNHRFYNTFYTLAPFPTHLWSYEKKYSRSTFPLIYVSVWECAC